MFRFQVRTAKCKKCQSPIVQLFEIMAPDLKNAKGSIPYSKIRVATHGMSNNWRVEPRGYRCSRRGCKEKVFHTPQPGFTREQVKERLKYFTYSSKDVEIFELKYDGPSRVANRSAGDKIKDYKGPLYSWIPKLGVKREVSTVVESRLTDPQFIIMAKSKEALFNVDASQFVLVRADVLPKLTSKESTGILFVSEEAEKKAKEKRMIGFSKKAKPKKKAA